MKNVYFFYSGKYYIENKEFEYISNILKPMYELGPIDMSYFYYNSKHIIIQSSVLKIVKANVRLKR